MTPDIDRARQLYEQGRLDEACTLYERLRATNEQDIELLLNLAVIYRKKGFFVKAESASRHALSLQPDNALANHIYASVQQCLGNIKAAIAGYRKAVDLDPSLAEACYFLGNALQLTGQLENAVECYRNAVAARPDYLEALSNMGAVLLSLHRPREARAVLEKANSLYPDSAQVLCNLGDLSLAENDPGMAGNHAKAALEINPAFVDGHYLLGKICRLESDYDGALRHYRNALAIQPDNENIIGSIAEILEIRGEFAEAHRLLEPLIGRNTTNPLVLRIFSALSRHYGNENGAVSLLEQALAAGGLDTSRKIKLHSELGKQYDHLKDYSRAFEHYRHANELERELGKHLRNGRGTGYPGAEDIDKWFQEFDSGYWRRLPRSGIESKRPIFVVGMPRSGTTLAEQILASHPEVHGAGELPDIADLVARLEGKGRLRSLARLDANALRTSAEKYLAVLDGLSEGAARVVDKMPTNFWHLGIISLMFPQASIIHMTRDPRDVCLSIYFQHFSASMAFTTDLGELAKYYHAYQRIMDYWKTVLDMEILDVRYEHLVTDQEAMIRRMTGFCGLDWDERCLRFHESGRDIHTPSYDQVRLPMYSSSIGRWRHYERQLARFSEYLGLGDRT